MSQGFANRGIEEFLALNSMWPLTIAHYRLGSDQSVPDATNTIIEIDTEVSVTDPYSIFSLNTSTGVVTVNRSGWYDIRGSILWASSALGRRILALVLNGSTLARLDPVATDSSGRSQMLSVRYPLSAGSTVALEGYQNVGGPLNALGHILTHLGLQYLGEAA